MLPSLYNTEISEKRAVGYCKRHHCYITSTQVKHKACLSKQCYHLERREHEFWRQRELMKMKRRNRKEIILCR
jgi:hypothetical protein